jgi:hypothetical protein
MVFGNSLSAGTPTDATVTTAKLADSAVTYAKIGYNANQFRNIIINGDMSIAQRSTSVSGANSSGYKSIDRYRHTISIGTWTISQSTDVPTGQGFAKSMKMDCTTAEASPGSTDALAFVQKIEGQNLQYLKKGTSSAESLTVSFWVKSNKTGNAQVNLIDEDNTRMIGKQWSISSANTWEKKTLTFAGDTSGALGNDNGSSLRCEIWLDAGSDYKTGATPTSWETLNSADYFAGGTLNLGDNTANEIYITGVQLEVGTAASDFEFLPHDLNLQRCKRYFNAFFTENNMVIFQYQGGFRALYYPYPIAMRTSPTLSVDTFVGFSAFNGSVASTTGIYAYENVSSTDTNTYAVGDCELDAEL